MAHHITESDNMFSVREVPWHGLGRVVQDAPTARDAVTLAGLDWTVDSMPLFASNGDDVVDVTGFKAAVRSDNKAVLGVVGDGYVTVQNRDAFDFCDVLAGGGDVTYETAGSLDGGRRVWMLARLTDRYIQPVAGDVTVPYLLLSNAHDGSGALRAMLTTVRVVCNNTLTLAFKSGAVQGLDVKIRHSGNVEAKVRAARSVFAEAVRGVDEYAQLTTMLAQARMTDEAWDKLLNDLFPIADDAVRTGRTQGMRDRVRDLAESGAGADIPGVRGTAWGALNAVTEFVTHERGTRSENGRAAEDAKLEALFFRSGAQMGNNALDWLTSYAKRELAYA